MEIDRGQLSRRGLFIATGNILLTAASGCLPKQPTWSEKLRQQGEKVKADLLEVGIGDEEWHQMIPFDRLTPAERQELDVDCSLSRYVITKNNKNCANSIVFLIETKLKGPDSIPKRLKVVLPLESPVYVTQVANAGAEWMPIFNLAKFLDYKTTPNGIGSLSIIKHDNAASYLGTPDAITSMRFKGSAVDFNSFADVIEISASKYQ